MSDVIQFLRRGGLLPDGPGMTDGQLLECFITQHNDAAFAALVQRHAPMVWGVCHRVLRSHPDAEDAFQATFLVLVRKAVSIVPRERVANWLYGVAYQTARKARATAARRKARERQVEAMPEPAVQEHDLWCDLQPILDQELSRLPEKYRVAIVLCDVQGKTRQESAQQLGLPEGTLSGRLTRGRRMLAKRLARRGVMLASAALAGVLSKAASACAPPSVVSSTIQAASRFAAAQAAPGVISAEVAALTEGVLKTMLVNKTKMAAAILMVGLLGVCATGLAYRVMAGERPSQAQEQSVKADLPLNAQQEADRALQKIKAELERLRTENEALKKQLRRAQDEGTPAQVKKPGDGKLVVKIYPVRELTPPPEAEEKAKSLMQVLSTTIDPSSWNLLGGQGSMVYYPQGYCLVIRQSPDVHKQVQDLLDTLEKIKTEQEKKMAAPREERGRLDSIIRPTAGKRGQGWAER
jgi:RNA polymerase sigma factor (sigma-70 family)